MRENLFLLVDQFLASNRILNKDKNLETDLLALGNTNIYNLFKTLSKYVAGIDLYDISESSLDALPKTFIGTDRRNIPVVVDRKKNGLFISGKEISASSIEPYIIAPAEKTSLINYLLKRYTPLLFILFATTFLVMFFWYNLISIYQRQFVLLSFAGLFLALTSNKDLFADNSFFSNFCSKKCSVVQNSKDWKIFEFLDFSALSLTYFITQIIVVLIFRSDIFPVFAKISYLSYFFIIISICYQVYLKKICKICISTSLVLLLQAILSYNFEDSGITREFISEFIFFTGTFMFLFYGILSIKKLFSTINSYKKEVVNAKKISNNPEYISKIVFNSPKVFPPELFNTSLTDKKNTLFIYTSITCKHCRHLHTYLSKIIDDFGNIWDIRFSFFVDFEDAEQEAILIYKKLVLMLIRDDFNEFHHILGELYKDYYESINNFEYSPTEEEEIKIQHYFTESNEWSERNNIYYAPFVLINNHSFSHEFNYSILYDVIERLTVEYDEVSIL